MKIILGVIGIIVVLVITFLFISDLKTKTEAREKAKAAMDDFVSSINAAANGAVKPKSKTFTETASEISARDQLKASCKGISNTDGADLNPALAIRVKKVTPAAYQAG